MSAEKKKIEQMAYQIWEAEGRPAGRDLDHWIAAETAVKGPAAAKPKTAKPKAAPAASAKPKAEKKAASKPAKTKTAAKVPAGA